MIRLKMIGSAASQLLNVITARNLDETGPNESISARSYRQGLRRRVWLDWAAWVIFGQYNHCKKAYMSDVQDAYALIAEYEGTTRPKRWIDANDPSD